MDRKTKLASGPEQVLDMLQDCFNEAEANGFEVAQSASKIGDALSWFDPEVGARPTLESVSPSEMIFKMPNGSRVRVKASWIRR